MIVDTTYGVMESEYETPLNYYEIDEGLNLYRFYSDGSEKFIGKIKEVILDTGEQIKIEHHDTDNEIEDYT